MRILKVKSINETLCYYDKMGQYVQTPIGTQFIAIEAYNDFIILENLNETILCTYTNKDFFEVITEFTDKPEAEIKVKEVPVEVTKIITLKDVIGQEIENITFK